MSTLIRILFSAAEAEWSGTAQLCLCCATARGADKTRETSQCLALKFGSKILEAIPDVLIGNLNKFLFSFDSQGDAKLSSRLQTQKIALNNDTQVCGSHFRVCSNFHDNLGVNMFCCAICWIAIQ